MKNRNNILLFVLFLGAFSLMDTGSGSADTLFTARGEPVVETEHSVKVTVKDGLGTLTVRRVFKNKGSQADQIELEIELPRNSVATGMRIKGKKEWYDAELMEAEMASIVYERLTGMGSFKVMDPALLTWSDLGMLDLLVFPVNPGGENIIEYTLIQPLEYEDGMYVLFYPSAVNGADLAVPQLKVIPQTKKSKVMINGKKVGFGKKVAAGKKMFIDDDVAVYDADGDTLCDDESCLEETLCRDPGETMIAVKAPAFDMVKSRYGLFDLGTGASVVRLEIDTAEILRPAPKKASVVFVVDASRSWGRAGIEAALSFCSAFVKKLPDAKYEVVLFRRDAGRLFGELVTSGEWKKRLVKVSNDKTLLQPRNGSHLEKGLELAASILEDRKGPSRIIALTDGLMRGAYHNALSFKALAGAPDGAVVHFVELESGESGSGAFIGRNDDHELAPVPLSRGGILVEVSGGEKAKDFADVVLGLVRPIQIDDFEISCNFDDFSDYGCVPDILDEGLGLRYMFIAEQPQASVTLQGRIWASPFTVVVSADQDFSDSILPALVFSTELYQELERDELLRAATAGKAVSPVTSYLSIEPGTRPSTIGLEDVWSVTLGAAVSALGALGGGKNVTHCSDWESDYASILQALLMDAAAPCFFGAAADSSLDVFIETTLDEIADVEAAGGGEKLRKCVEEAAWSIELPGIFVERLFSANITLP